MIKFRAWNDSEGKYISWEDFFCEAGDLKVSSIKEFFEDKSLEFEQYLSDKYCEGDIVKLDDDRFVPIVKDGAGCFCLDLTGNHRIKILVPITEHYFREVLSKCEVSGNVHENGGLLP